MIEAKEAKRSEITKIRKWRPTILVWLTTICGFLGSSVLIYPTAASWVSQYNQSAIVRDYVDAIADADPTAAEQLRSAHAYNNALSSGAVLEANTSKPSGLGNIANGIFNYDQQLVVNGSVMARLRIPAIDLDLPIYHGTSDATLLKGLGHLEGTSLPIGGTDTHSVITGHRGLANATMFTNLDKVEAGDTFTLEVLGEVLTYRVYETKVVEPTDTETLRQIPGQDIVTLITCTPLGVNSHRILVTAERITPTPIKDLEAAGDVPNIPGFPWWIIIYSGAMTLVGLYLWKAGYRRIANINSSLEGESDDPEVVPLSDGAKSISEPCAPTMQG